MRPVRRRSEKAGAPPGTLVHVGEHHAEPTRIHVTVYDRDQLDEHELTDPGKCSAAPERVTWVSVTGLREVETVRTVGECFGLHPLVLEDLLDTGHRPKIDEFDEYLFCICRVFDPAGDGLSSRQVSLVLRPPVLLSFEEVPGPLFDPVRERLRTGFGQMREAGADYLLYALLDSIVDSYFGALESIGARIEDIEEAVIEQPEPKTLRTIHRLRSEVASIRHAVGPMREVIGHLGRGRSSLMSSRWEVFLRDVYDHVIQVAETTESLRDALIGMLDIYLSSASNRMNEVMKVLTMIATIFIPATFVAGVYGMNFEWMPELRYRWGYPAALGVMLAIAVGMLVYFRRKRWL
ncbi:MAG: magnesium/cobalt transporter CorA [Armatimonadota bacterium]|jgi:magnesium transporter